MGAQACLKICIENLKELLYSTGLYLCSIFIETDTKLVLAGIEASDWSERNQMPTSGLDIQIRRSSRVGNFTLLYHEVREFYRNLMSKDSRSKSCKNRTSRQDGQSYGGEHTWDSGRYLLVDPGENLQMKRAPLIPSD